MITRGGADRDVAGKIIGVFGDSRATIQPIDHGGLSCKLGVGLRSKRHLLGSTRRAPAFPHPGRAAVSEGHAPRYRGGEMAQLAAGWNTHAHRNWKVPSDAACRYLTRL